MKKILIIFLTIIGFTGFSVNILSAKKNICSFDYIKKEENIRKVYLSYRMNSKNCLSAWHLYKLGERAYLAGRLSEALWSTKKALQKISNKNSLFILKLKNLKGSIFREMNRIEEAIIILRKIVFFDMDNLNNLGSFDKRNYSKKKKLALLELEQQKALLQLIYAYYEKTGSKESNDVKYLVNLFKGRYKNGTYMSLLSKWFQGNV